MAKVSFLAGILLGAAFMVPSSSIAPNVGLALLDGLMRLLALVA